MKPDQREPIALTVRDTAHTLAASYATIYRMVRAGVMPSVRIGGQYRILRRDLEAYLARARRAGSEHE